MGIHKYAASKSLSIKVTVSSCGGRSVGMFRLSFLEETQAKPVNVAVNLSWIQSSRVKGGLTVPPPQKPTVDVTSSNMMDMKGQWISFFSEENSGPFLRRKKKSKPKQETVIMRKEQRETRMDLWSAA